MKYILSIICMLSLFGTVRAQQDEGRETASSISEVTVFLKGAQVTRSADVQLRSGENVLIFRGLADGIDAKSIQVSAPGNVLINSVVKETNYLQRQKQAPRVQKLEDSLLILRDLLELEANQRTNLNQEKSLLLKNQSLASEEQGLNIEELARAADFFRKRFTDIEDQLMAVGKREKKYKEDQKRIRRQLKELNYKRNQPSNDIRLVLRAPSAQRAKIEFQYLVGNAGWVPNYDLRAKDIQSPIQLDYKADVYQNTGVDWEKVNLTLSSGNPNLGGTTPNLTPWNLYVRQEVVPVTVNRKRSRSKVAETAAAPTMVDEESDDAWGAEEPEEEEYWGESETLADYTTVEEGATTAEFVIGVPQTVPSGTKPQQVAVQSADLPAVYRHYAVPKLDKDAFLVAGVTEWESLNLLPGNVQIFFEGTYVTESYIDPAYTKDTIDFSMGRDKKVIVQREQLRNFSDAATIGFNREKTMGYEIRIRNTKAEAINLQIEDQIPVSQDKDITVKVIEKTLGELDEDTGKVKWDLKIGPSQTATLKLVFSVKYPKNKVVPGL